MLIIIILLITMSSSQENKCEVPFLYGGKIVSTGNNTYELSCYPFFYSLIVGKILDGNETKIEFKCIDNELVNDEIPLDSVRCALDPFTLLLTILLSIVFILVMSMFCYCLGSFIWKKRNILYHRNPARYPLRDITSMNNENIFNTELENTQSTNVDYIENLTIRSVNENQQESLRQHLNGICSQNSNIRNQRLNVLTENLTDRENVIDENFRNERQISVSNGCEHITRERESSNTYETESHEEGGNENNDSNVRISGRREIFPDYPPPTYEESVLVILFNN
ncbi:hypothetical protein MHBO_000016 [Bonamia ostreae]|uniref:Sushi domain-containing protein n=1 Tax=Bonamia ostreae TaxID=126728 RepID=A0ABV2AEU1_9EUKA